MYTILNVINTDHCKINTSTVIARGYLVGLESKIEVSITCINLLYLNIIYNMA